MTRKLLLAALGLLLYVSFVDSADLVELIASLPALSQVAKIIEEDGVLPTMLRNVGYMAFLPNDNALSAYEGVKDARLIKYHLSNLPYLAQDLPEELNTDLQGNPRVYVSKLPSHRPATTGWEHLIIYINDAKIIDANHEAVSSSGMKQMLHIVDRVITPTVPRDVNLTQIDSGYLNPDAQKLIMKPHYYGLTEKHSISVFQSRMVTLSLHDVYNITGKNTFFIPVDAAMNTIHDDKTLIDKQVIHGHVVPGKVLFTRTVQDPKEEFESMAFTDNLKVLISMENVTNYSNPTEEYSYYVKSKTIAGDTAHAKGTVLARIQKGNIPVKNGVVHLIDRPLMMVATNVISYLQQKDGQLTKFYDLIRQYNVDLSNKLTVGTSVTVFAPSNKAFNKVNKERFQQILLNTEKIKKLLRLHIVERHITTDEIMDHRTKEVQTLDNGRKLYFNINNPGAALPTMTIEGSGVTATITTPDIAAKNGVIHIIDGILGIPSQTVYEKLSSDPMLSSTFNLSQQEGWNERLKNRDELYTLFVPSNDAWDKIRQTMPSAFKKLFMGSFPYQVRYILERHMIANQAFSVEQLGHLTTNTSISTSSPLTVPLNMTRGKVYFQARVINSFGEYFTEWDGVRAHVIRRDLECVNGVVHVINKVMMKNRDVTVSGSAVKATTGLASLAATFFTVAFARALHH